MNIYAENMPDICTFWAKAGQDAYGMPTFSAPITMQCRWQDSRVRTMDAQGREFITAGVIYTPAILSLDGKIANGSMAGTPPVDAMTIRDVYVTHNLDGTESVVKVLI